MKSFIPFDAFEKGCDPQGKPLAATMQENCNDRLAPEQPKPCSAVPCPPYWQPTGITRCVEAGFVDAEEKDGCGNSRWTRTVNKVVWTDTGVEECDTPINRFKKEQINQCGTKRMIITNKLCCIPEWVNTVGGPNYNCDQSMLRVEQEDGCGNTRLKANGQAVVWTGTGEARCQPGDIYEIEQINQCGDVRWTVVGNGCPCIPEWTDFGSQRCTGEFVEQNQVDGCGAARWHNTGVAVVWVPNGEERCGATGFVQYQEVSQCGTTRWVTSEVDTCVNSPPPNDIGNMIDETQYCNSSGNTSIRSFILNASTKLVTWTNPDDAPDAIASAEWVTGSVNRADYEARISFIASEPLDADRQYTGSAVNTWFNLGDYTTVGGTFTAVSHTGPGTGTDGRREWNFTEIRIDIRRVGGSIEGSAYVGPFRLVGGGDCEL